MQNGKLLYLYFFYFCFVCAPPQPPNPPLPSLGTARWQSSSSAVLFIHSSCLMGVLLPSLREAMCLQNDTRDKRKLLFSEHSRGRGARAQQPGCVGRGTFHLHCRGKKAVCARVCACVCVCFRTSGLRLSHCCPAGGRLSFLPL